MVPALILGGTIRPPSPSEVAMPIDVAVAGEELDPIAEMKLRTWARRNYCRPGERDGAWHPVILEEMSRKDDENADH